MNIDADRLAMTFTSLVEIDSPSRSEAAVAKTLAGIFGPMGAEISEDDAAAKVGGDSGNLIVKFKGTAAAPPLMLNAHMDTVSPGNGIRAILKDGRFYSDGTTILGADDKSAIAIIIETLRRLIENNIPFGPLELVFTVCEEIGLMGAKHLDFDMIDATYGFSLDATDTHGIVTRAPSANRLEFVIHGKDAHAGAAPERGINAILLAARAIAGLELGRIDAETTCNIGIISGGVATNIIPSRVIVEGEVRSHSEDKLKQVTDRIVASFEAAVFPANQDGLPRLEMTRQRDFSHTDIPEDHHILNLANRAAANLGKTLRSKTTGGGADANIFFEKGIMVGVLGTGMADMHTVRESIALTDMIDMTELLVEIVRLHACRA